MIQTCINHESEGHLVVKVGSTITRGFPKFYIEISGSLLFSGQGLDFKIYEGALFEKFVVCRK
jgi:hypothetical protein